MAVARLSALIVESDPDLSALGAAMLGEFGMDVEQVVSGEAAIDHLCLRAGAVGVVVADMTLPGRMSGLDLAHRIAVLWPAVSVIVVCTHASDEGMALPVGATFIRKPWHALDIVSEAERAVRADHSVQAVRL